MARADVLKMELLAGWRNRFRDLAAILPIVALPSFLLCMRHFCQCGHLAHDTYPRWHWYSDYFWIGSFGIAAALGICSSLKGRLWFGFWLLGMLFNRLWWNNGFGLIFDMLGLPTILWLAIRGLLARRRPH